MRRLKSYNKFNESSLWSKSTIEDLLLDMYDKGVEVSVNVGTWPLDIKVIEQAISTGNKCEQVQLTFSSSGGF